MDQKVKLILFGIVGGIVALVFIGIFVLIALGRDTEQVTTYALIVIPSLITAGGLGAIQARQSEKLDQIGKNVNGNMTTLLNHTIQQKTATGSTPVQYVDPMPDISDETIDRIRNDVGNLPRHSA